MEKERAHYQNTRIKITKGNLARIRLKAEIVFGSPSMGCKGSGVCKVLPVTTSVADWKCSHATAWLSITENQKLRISFLKYSMSNQQIQRYFRWHLFQVFEPFAIPMLFEQRLKAHQPLVLLPGIYSVAETTDELIVDF